MRRLPLVATAVPLLLGLSGGAALAAKKAEQKLFPLPHMDRVFDDRGAGADRVPDLRSVVVASTPAGMSVEVVLHEPVPAWEHLVRVLVSKKDGTEADRAVRVRSEKEWVVEAKEEKSEDAAKPKDGEKKSKKKFPREVAAGALTHDGPRYTFVVPWSALPEGELWVWAETMDWDPDAKAEEEGDAAGSGDAKAKKAERKPMEKLNLTDRAPDGDRVLVVAPGAAPTAAQ